MKPTSQVLNMMLESLKSQCLNKADSLRQSQLSLNQQLAKKLSEHLEASFKEGRQAKKAGQETVANLKRLLKTL
jgi:hypothetical protein